MSDDWKLARTNRGFERIEFKDRYEKECSLQQSSMIGDAEDAVDRPGSSCIWLGCEHEEFHHVTGEPIGARMHLSLDQVKRLIPLLKKWVDSGSFHG